MLTDNINSNLSTSNRKGVPLILSKLIGQLAGFFQARLPRQKQPKFISQ